MGASAGATLMAIIMGYVTPVIQGEEGTKYTPYHDVANVLTVCSGHTGPDVVVGKVYKPEQCAALTKADAEKASAGVLKVSPHLLYHPLILATAISFSYNVGVTAYAKSSVARDFNAGNFTAGCDDLMKYTYAGGKWNAGLYDRRHQEQQLCLESLTAKGAE